MNSIRHFTVPGLLLALAECLLQPVWCLAAEEAARKPGYSTNAADRAACQRQLNMIFGAIQEYRKQHDNGLPSKLSDLTPDFIHDPNVLICPFVQKRGGLRTWKKQFRELSPDAHTSYGYEFPSAPLDYYQWRGVPKKTWREFKERVAETLGPVVPIVRCHDHRPWLNLAVGGRIYESELYWEKNFAENDHLLTVSKLFGSPVATRKLTPADFPPRDPQAGLRLLDLTAHYNAALTDSWQGFPGNHLAGFRTGIREFGGVCFDVRGVIQLRGELAADFPGRIDGIKVNQKCNRIHFLHALACGDRPGVRSGLYTIHYEEGRAQEIPLVYGEQIADWWFDPPNPIALTNGKVVWTGENEAAKAYGKAISLYQYTWENPLKGSEVATISFDSGVRTHAYAPFVVAITLE